MVARRIVTIHEVREDFRFGYETSQLSRDALCKEMGWEHVYILTNPQFRGNWYQLFQDWGFKGKVVCVPFFFSELAFEEAKITEEELESDMSVLERDSQGHILITEDKDSRYYYQKKKFLQVSKNENFFNVFASDGEVVLSGEFVKEPHYKGRTFLEPSWLYTYQGHVYTEEELLVLLLQRLNFPRETTLYIKDKLPKKYPVLNRFMLNTGQKYYQYIHFDLLENAEHYLMKNHFKYLCANEILTAKLVQLGYDVHFLNPIIVANKVVEYQPAQVKRQYCYIGHAGRVKNMECLIKAAYLVEDQDVMIDVYGIEGYVADRIPSNLVFKGYQKEIPYQNYSAYLSTSLSECFANACVEALSHGLFALLSDVDFAHREYDRKSVNVKLFSTAEELAELLLSEHQAIPEGRVFLQDYNLENTLKRLEILY